MPGVLLLMQVALSASLSFFNLVFKHGYLLRAYSEDVQEAYQNSFASASFLCLCAHTLITVCAQLFISLQVRVIYARFVFGC
jgi:hypothetical protein